MTKKIKNFQEFYDTCDKLYAMYEPHFFLQGCEIITNFESNEIDNECWYCIIKLRDNVHTVLAYDHSESSDDNPFVVYCNWAKIPISPNFQNFLGYFTECEEFDNIEQSFYYMVQEPSFYLNRWEDDLVTIRNANDKENVYEWTEGHGVIEAIRAISINKDYSGETMEVVVGSGYNERVFYRKETH